MEGPGILVLLVALVLGVIVLRFVVRLAIRLALIGLLIVGALWLWRGGTLDGLPTGF